MNKLWTAAMLGVSATGLCISTSASARGDAFPDSFIAISGGSGTLNASSSGGSTGSISGTAYGIALRKTFAKAGVIDVGYDRYNGSKNGVDLTADRIDAGIGFLGGVGADSSLLMEAVYSAPKLKSKSSVACGGDCGEGSKHGFGIKAGFIVPIGTSFISSLTVQLLKIEAASGDPIQGQATIEGSVGYKISPAFGVHGVFRRDAYENKGNEPGASKLFASSFRGMLSYNF